MEERDKIIITITFSIIGIILIIIIICFIIWFIRHRKLHLKRHKKKFSLSSYKQEYPRLQKFSSNKSNNKNKRKKRYNTNDSAISLSFNPPHLINQNVKNLNKLQRNESLIITKPYHYDNKISITKNNYDRCYINPPNEIPIYTSSSSVSPTISNLGIDLQSYQQLNSKQFKYLNELNHILYIKSKEKPTYALKYSQSCRQTNDLLPFDYYRSLTPSILTTTISSNENSLEPIHIRTNSYSNATLMRKARLAQLRDDTAILY